MDNSYTKCLDPSAIESCFNLNFGDLNNNEIKTVTSSSIIDVCDNLMYNICATSCFKHDGINLMS